MFGIMVVVRGLLTIAHSGTISAITAWATSPRGSSLSTFDFYDDRLGCPYLLGTTCAIWNATAVAAAALLRLPRMTQIELSAPDLCCGCHYLSSYGIPSQ